MKQASSMRLWLGRTQLWCCIAALLFLACGADDRSAGRVLIVGIDGATLRVAGPMLQAGRLPNLAQLAREGASGPLQSIKPILSPRIWNSIATGKVPRKHGILDFARQKQGEPPHLFLSTDRRVHALWNILSDAGRSVAVVNWWNTFPPDVIDGVMVSDHLIAREIEGRRELSGATETPVGSVVYPPEWQDKITHLLEDRRPPVVFPDPFLGKDLPHWILEPKHLSTYFREDGALTKIALAIEAETNPDLLMVLLPGIDRVSHFLWAVMEPPELYPPHMQPSESGRAAGRAALEAQYEYTDALIGKLLERYQEGDLVIVLSDHGFESALELMILTGNHLTDDAIEGLIFARAPGIAPSVPAGEMSVLDVVPTILAWLELPVAADMDGSVAGLLKTAPSEIPSYDTAPIARLEAGASGGEEQLIERLQSLGYIESTAGDPR